MEANEAHVTYSPSETSPPILAEKIDSLGFPCRIKDISPLNENSLPVVQMETTIAVKGMTCMSCVRNIEGTVGFVDGVKEIKVSLEKKEAFVKFDPFKLTPQAIADKIDDMGFEATLEKKKANSLIARIHVEGMTCQNCVNTIESFLKKKEGVEEIRVSLEDKEAFIIYSPDETNPNTLRDIIDDMGFTASLPRETSVDREFDMMAQASVEQKEKETVIDIEGMVCMSCVKNIESNIAGKPGILNVKVSLENKNGTFRYDSTVLNPEKIAEMVDDMGFDAKVSATPGGLMPIQLGEETQTVVINIKGMTCNSCVQTIEGKLIENPGVKKIQVSLANQNGTIVYYPNRVTPNMLAEAIEDMGFEASVKGRKISVVHERMPSTYRWLEQYNCKCPYNV